MDFSALQWLQTSPAAFPAVKADFTASWRARDAANSEVTGKTGMGI